MGICRSVGPDSSVKTIVSKHILSISTRGVAKVNFLSYKIEKCEAHDYTIVCVKPRYIFLTETATKVVRHSLDLHHPRRQPLLDLLYTLPTYGWSGANCFAALGPTPNLSTYHRRLFCTDTRGLGSAKGHS
eukprot:COSAG01_NODE_2092_length_8449_cov_36.532934_4_plen_131_part_00